MQRFEFLSKLDPSSHLEHSSFLEVRFLLHPAQYLGHKPQPLESSETYLPDGHTLHSHPFASKYWPEGQFLRH